MREPTLYLRLRGPEASWISRALEEAGISVRTGDDEPEAGAPLVVDSSVEELAKLAHGHDGPVIVVGWEPLTPADAECFGEHDFMERPVAVKRLVHWAKGALGLDASRYERERTVHLEDEGGGGSAGQTVQLDDASGVLSAVFRVGDEVSKVSEAGVMAPSSTGALDAPEAAASEVLDQGRRVMLSPELDAILRAADERLFPGEAPLDLRLSVGSENVRELVPDELLAEVAVPLDVHAAADPLEAFTFVGTPDLLDTAQSRRPRTGTPMTSAGVLRRRPEVGTDTPLTAKTDLTREGLLPAGGAMRMLWQLRGTRGTELSVDIPGDGALTMMVLRGRVVAMSGLAYTRLARRLRQEGLLKELTDSEEESAAAIERAISDGVLSAFSRDRRLRLEREALVGELCVVPECRYRLAEAPDLDGPGVLAAPLIQVATERLRYAVGAGDVMRWLELKSTTLVWLSASFQSAATELGLEPELRAAFERHAGEPLRALLTDEAAVLGAAGALFALASAEALRFEAAAGAVQRDGEGVRQRIERAHALAIEGDYFRILDVPRTATTREIREAHELQVRALAHLDPVALDLHELEGPRLEALEAIDDAFDVLKDERLRQVYLSGLG